jgi:hypothetical protein
MSSKPAQPKSKPKTKILPRPDRAQSFKEALEATNKQFAETLARLAK